MKIMHRYIDKLNFIVFQTTILYGMKSIIASIENYHQGKLSFYHHKLLDHFVEASFIFSEFSLLYIL